MLSFKKLTIVLMGAALLFGGAVKANQASAAPRTASHGTGKMFPGAPGHSDPVWAGTWNNGPLGFCIDFGSTTPDQSGTSVKDGKENIPNMTWEASRQAKFVANKYAATTSPDEAANAGLAIWHYRNDSAFNKWYKASRATGAITTERHNAMYAIIFDAREHSEYKVTVDITRLQVGQTGSGTVKVLGSNGWPAVGRLITLLPTQLPSGPNGKVLKVNGVAGSTGHTGSTGLVAFTYQRTTTGTVGIRAMITAPSSENAGLSITSYGHQRTLSGGFNDYDYGYDGYNHSPNAPTIAPKCDSDCNGVSQVTFQYYNTKGAQAIKWNFKDRTGTVAEISAQPGTTGSVIKPLNDGKVIETSSFCYTGTVLGGPCLTNWVTVVQRVEIFCPPWAQAELVRPCKCTPDLPSSVTMSSPASSLRFYRVFVTLSKGAVIPPVDLVNGKPTTISTGRLAAGTKVVISFTAYRDKARTMPIVSHDLRTIRVN